MGRLPPSHARPIAPGRAAAIAKQACTALPAPPLLTAAARRRRRRSLCLQPQPGDDATARINSLSFHRTEDKLVTASDDDAIRLYDTQTGAESKCVGLGVKGSHALGRCPPADVGMGCRVCLCGEQGRGLMQLRACLGTPERSCRRSAGGCRLASSLPSLATPILLLADQRGLPALSLCARQDAAQQKIRLRQHILHPRPFLSHCFFEQGGEGACSACMPTAREVDGTRAVVGPDV